MKTTKPGREYDGTKSDSWLLSLLKNDCCHSTPSQILMEGHLASLLCAGLHTRQLNQNPY